ncbi:hypothetical protein PVAP13_3KG015800 [Panicum virgatum]|uniref:Uncharacterized protein n=1 Tax=Panicum virgatum TaxID=38727 RepID=A0A8T0UG08_PANVG|nr:hypothetical protein PVAP13_3KG015800 [Panicum virgatum]
MYFYTSRLVLFLDNNVFSIQAYHYYFQAIMYFLQADHYYFSGNNVFSIQADQFFCSEKSCMFLVHSASKSLIQFLICIQSGTKKNSLVLIEFFSCYIDNSIEVLLLEILCCILCSLQPFFHVQREELMA